MTTTTSSQTNDYIEMLIAAGWITAESLDDDYQAYVKRIGKYDAATYEGWNSMKLELQSLNDLWESTIGPVIAFNSGKTLNGKEKEIEDQIIRRTSELELFLGY